MEELYRERAVIRSSNRTRIDRKTNRLSLALSLSPPTYNNSSSKNNNIRPVSRSLLVLDTRPSANDEISVAAVAACYVNTHGEKYDVSKKFAREWPIHAEQVEIEEVSSILPLASIAFSKLVRISTFILRRNRRGKTKSGPSNC